MSIKHCDIGFLVYVLHCFVLRYDTYYDYFFLGQILLNQDTVHHLQKRFKSTVLFVSAAYRLYCMLQRDKKNSSFFHIKDLSAILDLLINSYSTCDLGKRAFRLI